MKTRPSLLALFLATLSLHAAEPKGPWFTCDFEKPEWQSGWNLGNPNLPRNLAIVPHRTTGPVKPHYAPDTPPPLSGGGKPTAGNALAITLKQGTHYGADFGFDFAAQTGSEPEEAILSYKLCFAHDFNAEAVQGGKLPGFGGIYTSDAGAAGRRVNGSDSWSARGAYWKPDAEGDIPIGFYVYHADMKSDFGDTWYFSKALERGKWHDIRLAIKLNTPAAKPGGKGRNNGLLRGWLNGRQVFEKRDIRFRDVDTLKIRNAWFHFYHGGGQPASTDYRLWIDDVVISPAN
jgi:hypothetical protein